MSTKNKAREILWPKEDEDVLVRVAMLYVGQGSSTVLLVANGDTYKCLLVDSNLDSNNRGVNVPELVADLVEGGQLDVFVNTHPHDDHLRGITELSDRIKICEIWHSGHVPGRKYDDAYSDLQKAIKKLKKEGGRETKLEASKDCQEIGEASYFVLSPDPGLADDVNDEDPDARYNRIHEQSVVMKVGQGRKWIMVAGDANRAAFEGHIMKGHERRLSSVVLAAPHHGSRSFFKDAEDDEPYLGALRAISPEYVVISAPKRAESPHGHPDKDAVALYADEVGKDNVLHTGRNRYCFICDIYKDGEYSGVQDDGGVLAEEYPINGDSGDDKASKGKALEGFGIASATRVDDRPMGAQE